MKAIVNTGPNTLEMLEWPKPEPGPDQVRIRTGACGICATDIIMIHGWERTGYPAIPGHEWAGTVDAVGAGVHPSLIGCKCVANNVWADGGEVGFEHPGGYAEYIVTEARNVEVLPHSFPLTAAALIEPLAVSVRAMRRLFGRLPEQGELANSGPALVLGDGPIGLLMLALLARAGVPGVTLIGGRDNRLALAHEFGATQTLNYHAFAGDLAAEITARTAAKFAVVVEATGSGASMDAAIHVAAREGKVMIIGDYGHAQAGFPWNHVLLNELELIGSNASAGGWSDAVRLATTKQVPLERLVSHRLPAQSFAQGIDLMRARSSDVIKIVMEWE